MTSEPLINPSTKLLADSFIKNPTNTIGLTGPGGSGKLRVAQYLTYQTLELKPSEFDFKVKIIDCADNSGIDDIRDIKKSLSIKAVGQGLSRAVIFQNFNSMSIPAQNSILKLLEEPPLDTLLIILTDSKNSILPTIVSRLQWIDIMPLGLDELLKKYTDYGDSDIKQAYILSDGHIVSFEKILQQKDAPIVHAVNDAKKILKMKRIERIAQVENIINSNDYDLDDFLSGIQKIYQTLLRKEAESSAESKILGGLERIIKTKESLKYNSNAKLVLTDLFYRI